MTFYLFFFFCYFCFQGGSDVCPNESVTLWEMYQPEGKWHLPPSSNSHHTSMVPLGCFFLNWPLASTSFSFILAIWGGGGPHTDTGRQTQREKTQEMRFSKYKGTWRIYLDGTSGTFEVDWSLIHPGDVDGIPMSFTVFPLCISLLIVYDAET